MAANSAIAKGGLGARLATRTVFVKASPPPLTFAERRAVLHALKNHCRVDFFKKIKNNPSSYLSLTPSEEAAKTLIARSPLKYQLAVDPDDHTTHLSRPEMDPAAKTKDRFKATATPSKEFVIHIFPGHAYLKKHAELVQDSPLYGVWPGTGQPDGTSFMARSLRKSIPEGAMQGALADWETGGQLQEDGHAAGEAGVRDARFYAKRREQRRESKGHVKGAFGGA